MFEDRLELLEYEIRKMEKECSELYLSVVVNQNASPAMESLYHLRKQILEQLKTEKRNILEENGKQ